LFDGLLSDVDVQNDLQWMKEHLPTHPLIGRVVVSSKPNTAPGTVASSPNISSIPAPPSQPGQTASAFEQFEVEDMEGELQYADEGFVDQHEGDLDLEDSPAR
jgi:hypothetical protein